MFGFIKKTQFDDLKSEFANFVANTNSVMQIMVAHSNDNSKRIQTLEEENASIRLKLSDGDTRLTDHRNAIAHVTGLSDNQERFMGLIKDFLMTSPEFEKFCEDEVIREEIKEFLEGE